MAAPMALTECVAALAEGNVSSAELVDQVLAAIERSQPRSTPSRSYASTRRAAKRWRPTDA